MDIQFLNLIRSILSIPPEVFAAVVATYFLLLLWLTIRQEKRSTKKVMKDYIISKEKDLISLSKCHTDLIFYQVKFGTYLTLAIFSVLAFIGSANFGTFDSNLSISETMVFFVTSIISILESGHNFTNIKRNEVELKKHKKPSEKKK